MVKKRFNMFLLVILMTGTASIGWGVPGLINYQGQLTDNAGHPITSPVNVVFTFWDAAVGGSQLGSGFSDTDLVSPNAGGLYSTLIGDDPGALVPSSVFSGDNVWLNVNIDGEDLAPRKRITSVGYAEKAGTAESVQKTVRDFVLAAGESANAGDVVALLSNGQIRKGSGQSEGLQFIFDNAGVWTFSVAALSSTQFILAYADNAGSSQRIGTAIVGELVGENVIFGAPTVFNPAETNVNSVVALSASQFIVTYIDMGNSNTGTAIVGTVSGNNISFAGSAETIIPGSPYIEAVAAQLSPTQVVVAFKDWQESGLAVLANISGTSISFVNPPIGFATNVADVSVAGLTSTGFVLAYANSGSNAGKAIFGEVLGGTVSFAGSTASTFASSGCYSTNIAALSSSQIIITSSPYPRSAKVGNVSGHTLDFSGSASVTLGSAGMPFVSKLSSNSCVFTLENSAILANISGTTITLLNTLALNSVAVNTSPAAVLAPDKFIAVVAPSSNENTNYGAAVLGWSQIDLADGVYLGVAGACGTAGQSIPVVLDGLSDNHTGLTISQTYYASSVGGLSVSPTSVPVGLAVSPTEILLNVLRQ